MRQSQSDKKTYLKRIYSVTPKVILRRYILKERKLYLLFFSSTSKWAG